MGMHEGRYTKTGTPQPKEKPRMKVFTVKDTKAQTYETPFVQRNEVVALRAFSAEVNREDARNTLFTNPEDFELHCIGTFDPDTGVLTANKPELVGTALAVQKRETA